MALDLFAVAAPGQARCRRPDARGLRDLSQLGMRVAVKVGGSPDEARADMAAFEGPVVHVTDPLVRRVDNSPSEFSTASYSQLQVDHVLVQNVVRELISSAASRRPGVVYCETGVLWTGLVVSALQLALGRSWDEVLEERLHFEQLFATYDPARHRDICQVQDDYLRELARVSRPAAG